VQGVVRAHRGERGQATVELLSALPLLIIAALLVWQMLLVGIVMTSASNAARTGSRAVSLSGDGERAARNALRPAFRRGSEISVNGTSVRVRVAMPLIVPGVHLPVHLSSTATMPRT
jgi:TadE-like protein